MRIDKPLSSRSFWIGVVSRSHVQIGVRGGFIQVNHGKKAPLQRMHAGDGLAMYSPRTDYPDGEPLQHFTAIGSIASGAVYQVEMSADFKPWRIDVEFVKCREEPIRPLIEDLSFIKDKTHWGAAFRFGLVKVPQHDFDLIATKMECAKALEQNAR